MENYYVVGDPISHSRSPQIHKAFAAQIHKKIQYDKCLVPIGGLQHFLDANKKSVNGINVTVPLKEEAWRLSDILTDRAKSAGAVNTLWLDNGSWFGDNTDGIGFVKDLQDNLSFLIADKNIMFIGAGGAVRGVLNPVLDCGPSKVYIFNRNLQKAEKLVSGSADERVFISRDEKIKFDLIVNSTPSSLQGRMPQMPAIKVNSDAIFYDMSYGKGLTQFQKYGISRGCYSVDGIGMLVEQAAFSFFRWHGKYPETTRVLDSLRTK